MSWRVHLTNTAIQHLDILPGKNTLLAAWTQRDRATYFDLETGAELGEHQHKAVSRQSDRWPEFMASLVALNGAHLPLVRTAAGTIYTSEDGQLRLFHSSLDELTLDIDNQEIKLELAAKAVLVVVAFDRFMGVVAAVDAKGKLHLYQQHIRVGTFDLKLTINEETYLTAAIANGGWAVFVSDGHEIVRADAGGKVNKRLAVHYYVGRLVCSPNGKLFATSDPDTGVIRVYNGQELVPTHQRHAIDLLHDAAQLQLIADLPPHNAAPGALAIDDHGTLAFTMSGMVCVSSLKYMDELPRPQPLL
jgi:hypothetical protein